MKCPKCHKKISKIEDIGYSQVNEIIFDIYLDPDGEIMYEERDREPIKEGIFFHTDCGAKLPITEDDIIDL
jgi:hypothetical protein